jgi:HK97 family phage major capsid protein
MAYEPTNTWESLDYKSLWQAIETKEQECVKFVDDHKAENGAPKMSQDEANEFQARQVELGSMTKKWEVLREADTGFQKTRELIRQGNAPNRTFPHPQGGDGVFQEQYQQIKSLGELFTEAEAYKSANKESKQGFEVVLDEASIKTTLTTSAGFAPRAPRIPRVVESAQRRPVVADLIPQTQTQDMSILFMEETTFTNNGAAVSENSSKPESALAWTERTENEQVIATYVPITNQQLMAVPQMQALLNNRLTLMLELTEETELLGGSGSTPHLTGFYNKSGIQTQAKGSDPVPDAIYKAFTKVRYTGFAEPTGVVLHPNDWQDVRLLRTTDGVYIWGNPSEAGPERIWGKPVIVTPAATENTGLTGDFQLYSEIFRRMGIRIEVGMINDDLIKNKKTVLIEEMLALVIYRAAAFATVTGI